MKKFFLFLGIALAFAWKTMAATHEFSSIEEAQANASEVNREILEKAQQQEKLPTTDEEMREFVRNRMDKVDIMTFPEDERLDKISSFSKVSQEDEENKKSFWEKMYDKAMERIGYNPGVNTESLQPVKYYSLKQEKKEDENIPLIDIQLSNGKILEAPAYEHIPYFLSQIDILPNGMLKIYENIVIVANGKKVKEPISRFLDKKNVTNSAKIQIMLEEVKVNDEVLPYELVESNDYYIIRPKYKMDLPEGVYIFELTYVVDRSLVDIGDFYEFYWNVTSGRYNLVTTQAMAAVRLPGREPAVKRYALTGSIGNLFDNNAVVMEGEDNILGFANLYPLMQGEGMHLFLTIPKVDFTPITASQKMLRFIESYGDILLTAIYFAIVLISCGLSWLYIRNNLKFKNITLSSPMLVRYLWRGGADSKSVGCALLDLYRKSIIEIEAQDNDVILVRKTAHARHLSKFEKRVLSLLFSKKDSICRLNNAKQVSQLKELVKKQSLKEVKHLGLKLAKMYIAFNVLMLAALETGLVLWNPTSVLAGILGMVDVLLVIMIGAYFLMKGAWWRKFIFAVISLTAMVMSALFLTVYLSWTSIILVLTGIWIAVIFNQKASDVDALLKNGIQSTYQIRDFLINQRESIGNGRNFVAQQANIFALDVEDSYPNNDKIRSNYRLDMVKVLLAKVF